MRRGRGIKLDYFASGVFKVLSNNQYGFEIEENISKKLPSSGKHKKNDAERPEKLGKECKNTSPKGKK